MKTSHRLRVDRPEQAMQHPRLWGNGGNRRHCLLLVWISLLLPWRPECEVVASPRAQRSTSGGAALRVGEEPEQVIADLRRYIRDDMSRRGVPGLAIALVREGAIIWSEGFGVANSLSGRPVTEESVFEVASISKVVTAYTALRLIQQGHLSLDQPVSRSLSTPWLPASDWGDRITVRHLASHSSGLTDNLLLLDKGVVFEPGSEFLYSGNGFLYLQEAIEQVTGESLEEASKRLVFDPLGMSSSSFVNRDSVWRKMANGHLTYQLPTLIFLVPFLVGLVFCMAAAKIGLRIFRSSWKLSRRMQLVVVAIPTLSTLLLLTYVGRGLPHIVILSSLCGFAFVLVVGGVLVAASRLIGLPQRYRFLMLTVLAGFIGWALLFATSFVSGPIPTRPSPPPSAIGSLRTTAGDLARLLIEFSSPRLIDADLALQMHSPQIVIDDHFSWGLGIGIQHSERGDALWQNGNTFGFQSVMVFYPEQSWGVVVLTNSHRGRPVAYDVAHRALGGRAYWKDF